MSRYFVLDFDRTLCDTGRIVRRFENFLREEWPDVATLLQDERAEVERSGGSYDIVATLEAQTVDAGRLLDQFIETCADTEAYLLPGARMLLDILRSHDEPYGIMTYGGTVWQQCKLRLAGLSSQPTLIIPEKGKGVLIAGWRTKDGMYEIPGVLGGGSVREVILIDDKASEFVGLPDDGSTRGYWVVGEQLLPSQIGEVSSHVVQVASLYDILRREWPLSLRA